MASSRLCRHLPLRERVGRGVAPVSSTLRTRRLVVPNPLPQGEREPDIPSAKCVIADSTVLAFDPLPFLADQLELQGHAPERAAELLADLFVAVAGQLQLGDSAQGLISESLEPAVVLFGHHRGELGARLGTDDPVERVALIIAISSCRDHVGLAQDLPAPAIVTVLGTMTIDGLAGGQVDQQPPEVVAVLETREPALAKALVQRMERA